MAYVDKNTFEVLDNVIEIDDKIVETIQELNRKGYITTYCCSGHDNYSKFSIAPVFLPKGISAEQAKSMITDQTVDLGIYEENKVIGAIQAWQSPYISFADVYEFSSIPEGFDMTTSKSMVDGEYKDTVCISKILDIYKDSDRRILKTQEELTREIDETNRILLEWSKSLNNIRESKKVN